MLTLLFKKYVSTARIRQFGTLVTYNRSCIQMKMQQREIRPSYFEEQKLPVYRFYNSEANRKPNVTLPPLMNASYSSGLLYWIGFSPLIAAYKVNLHVDRDFDIGEFLNTSKHAVSVISHALRDENYEFLDGLVAEKTIQILRENVSRLSQDQRDLIAVDESDITGAFCRNIDVKSSTSEDSIEHIVEITTVYLYVQDLANKSHDSNEMLTLMSTPPITCYYKFQRTYTNNVGGPWIATVANHLTITNQEQQR